MPLRIALFLAYLAAASVYAVRRGGQPERLAASAMVLATIATAVVPNQAGRFAHVDRWVLGIDCLMLLVLIALASRADRFWPLWTAALQLVAITVHGVRAFDPTILPIVYSRFVGEIAYPIVTLLVIGTWRHRARVTLRGPERDWSPLVWL